MNQLKMTSPDDATKSIVVSFAAKWQEPLTHNDVTVVFRKRGPANFTPDFLYFYVGAPVSAVIGRAKITEFERLATDEAVRLADEGHINEKELRAYATGYDALVVFHLGRLQLAKTELSYSTLASSFGFSPPQSFFVLSKEGKSQLNKLAGFPTKSIH